MFINVIFCVFYRYVHILSLIKKSIAMWMRLSYTDQVKPPEFLKIDEGHEVINEDDKILIMASGTQACIPHMIAIKRMSKVRFRKDMDFSLGQKEMERKMNDRRHSILLEKQ